MPISTVIWLQVNAPWLTGLVHPYSATARLEHQSEDVFLQKLPHAPSSVLALERTSPHPP